MTIVSYPNSMAVVWLVILLRERAPTELCRDYSRRASCISFDHPPARCRERPAQLIGRIKAPNARIGATDLYLCSITGRSTNVVVLKALADILLGSLIAEPAAGCEDQQQRDQTIGDHVNPARGCQESRQACCRHLQPCFVQEDGEPP